jgi:uncharacterized protein
MVKRIAIRSCIGCGTVRPQNELVRFIRSGRGTVIEDSYKKNTGRGAYVCKITKERCLIKAISRHAFDRAIPISKGNLNS